MVVLGVKVARRCDTACSHCMMLSRVRAVHNINMLRLYDTFFSPQTLLYSVRFYNYLKSDIEL